MVSLELTADVVGNPIMPGVEWLTCCDALLEKLLVKRLHLDQLLLLLVIHDLRNKSHLKELLVCILAAALSLQGLSFRFVASRGLNPESVLFSFLHHAIRHVVHGYLHIVVFMRFSKVSNLTVSRTTFSLIQNCDLINVLIHVG